jgi:hypothetical protein
MFGPLKEAMGGKKFRSDEEVHQAVQEWLRTRQEFFSRGIRALPVRWRKFVERQGDYVEKRYTCVPLLCYKPLVKIYLRFSVDSPSYLHFHKKREPYFLTFPPILEHLKAV